MKLEDISKKLKKMFGLGDEILTDEATISEIDNALDVIGETMDKGGIGNKMKDQIEEMATTIGNLESSIEKITKDNASVISEMKEGFKLFGEGYKKEMDEVRENATNFENTVKGEIKNIKVGKSQDISDQENLDLKGEKGSEGDEGKKGFMTEYLKN